MPFQLAASTRRSFIAQLGGAVFSGPMLHGASAHRVDPDRIAILNDTHIGANHPGNSPVPTHLKETVAWLVNLERRPAITVVNGDLALSDGQPGDYEHFSRLIAPLHEAGIPVHVTLGNHDDRDAFYKVLQKQKPGVTHVESKHVGVVSLSKANIFLLDSLKAPLITQGLLGKDQLEWLGRMLDENAGKPALVFAHHNPRKGGEEKHYTGGLEDSDALWDLLVSRPQVKAYIHGHIHHRYYSQHRGIHIIDTPATSFVANPTASTTGWTMLQLTDQGGEFTTLTHDKTHPWNRAAEKLTWRAA